MASRQAGMFVAFLQDTDPAAFTAMMQAILDGCPFGEAVQSGCHTDLQSLWRRFVESMKTN